jgi:hypothetical protein
MPTSRPVKGSEPLLEVSTAAVPLGVTEEFETFETPLTFGVLPSPPV